MRYITVAEEGSTAILSIVRPKALNALNRAVVDELDQILNELSQKQQIKTLVLHNDENFAAGADIRDMADCDPTGAAAFVFSPTFNKLASFPVPTIAAMEGYALGGGLELALACDIRIAGESCKMGFPEISLGIMPGAGGTIRAPRLLGAAKAMEMIFSGMTVSAEEALRIGLVNRVVENEVVLEQAQKLAAKIASRSRVALEAAKRTVLAGLSEQDVEWGVAIEAQNWAALFASQDQKEGMHAFLEKRRPNFCDR